MPPTDSRPEPDHLLDDARRQGRGRLKVYLGMAPGVGKTYEMLVSAARRKADGRDVVVGVVETHGRRDTEALLGDLEVLPRVPLEHRGRQMMEFDLDGAIARRPQLLLVDEYAHSNAPGSRHPKRWQDVEEVLAAGIDVWTTLNVQHLESLLEVVWRITGVRQRETVPDSTLSNADEIEVVDLTPAELRERLEQGKVYVPDTARLAADRFFKPENLTALRELALRRAAQTVDDKLIGVMRRQGIEGPWAAGERIIVLVGPDPMASSLVRAGRRLSDLMMDAPWTAVHVEQPNRPPLSIAGITRRGEALRLAEQLGGSVVMLTGDDLVLTVLDYARRNNVTQIVTGRPEKGRFLTRFRRALPQALLEQSQGAALHIVTDRAVEPDAAKPAATIARRIDWRGYGTAAGTVALANGVAAIADRFTAGANLAMVFLVSVLVTGLGFGLWPALVAAGLAALTYNFFFLEPRYTIYIGHPADLFTFAVFFAVALATGWLTGRVRDQARTTSRRASSVTALLTASRSLSAASTRDQAAQVLADQTSAAASGAAVVMLPNEDDLVLTAGAPTAKILDTAAMTAARWAWKKGEAAGAGTGTLPQIGWTFHPLQGLRGRAGVAGVEARNMRHGSEEERFLLAMLGQGAVALERAELAASDVEHEALRRSDLLRSALLNSISHDLRTPLSTVLGSTTTLIDYGPSLAPEVRSDLLISIREEAERLNRYVGNLLDMTKLEGGALTLRREWSDVRDVLAAAIEQVSRRAPDRVIERDFPPELSALELDPALLVDRI